MYCLLSIVVFNVPILCGVSVVSLVDTIFVRSMFHFQDILFSSAYCWACEALPPQSAGNVTVWRSKTRPDIGTSFRANFGFIRRCFHCIAPRICWSACFDLLIQIISLLGWCPLRRFKSARTRKTQPECLQKSFSQIILISLVAIEKMVGAVLALFYSSCVLSALSSPLQ